MSSFLKFLAENKVWWITPIVLVLGLVAYLLFVQENDAGQLGEDQPFVYDMY